MSACLDWASVGGQLHLHREALPGSSSLPERAVIPGSQAGILHMLCLQRQPLYLHPTGKLECVAPPCWRGGD